MGVSKKAPLLGSSASVGESGSSVIEGDRNLLSHYGGSSERFNGGLSVATRKSAALRRNLVARGLAKQYIDQKAREENYKAQVPRYQRQKKILENYQRQQAHRDSAEMEAEAAERHEDSDDNNDFSENVVLVIPKRTNSAPSKPSGRPKRLVPPIVPPKGTTNFLRNTSMRQFRENQDEGTSGMATDGTPRSSQDSMSARLKASPSEADIPRAQLRPVPRPSSSRTQKEKSFHDDSQRLDNNLPSGPAPWLSSTHRSSRIVLSELAITKDIMMREQLVRQLKQALPLIDTIAQDVLKGQDDHMHAQAVLEAAKAISPSRMKKTDSLLGLALTSPVDLDQARNAETEAEVTVAESNARLAELTKRARHHIHHVGLLVNGLQQTTVSIVEGILDWRQLRQRRQQMSNFQRLFRFPWRRQKVANYLLHLNDDLRSLFPSVALELLLGPKATYNPLLLSRTILQILGTSTGKTFLTERDCSNVVSKIPSTSIYPERMKQCCINSGGLKKLQEVLTNSAKSTEGPSSPVKPTAPAVDHDRLRRCLNAIYQESELEALEKQRFGEEEHRVQSAYNPFSTIKSAGGVEETLSNLLVLQSPTSHLLGEQLRIRQEDTSRAAVPANGPQSTQKDASAEVLHINTDRLRNFLEKRAALLQPVADCELRDIQKWGMKNKLQGKIMVRKNNEKRVEHVLARKIQLQYLAHRQRNALQSNLTNFVRSVQVSVINIQRIFRGHRAKCDFASMRSTWLEHKRRVSAVRTIMNAFRRYGRRQRHRRSMTVESIAQTQLINLLATKLNEGTDQDATERYRRVGEERRRQRIVLLQKHKMEQQEIERKRVAAAIRMQAVVRAHLAQGQAKILRQEKKAHMNAVSAMAIQSTIRKFLNVQQERRHRFHKDLERVNQSAVRIQSIYRGYNSRASLLGQLDEQTRRKLETEFTVNTLHEGDTDDENDEYEDESTGSAEEDGSEDQSDSASVVEKPVVVQETLLPLIATSISRPSSTRSSSVGLDEKPTFRSRTPTTSVSLPPLWTRDGSSSSLVSCTSSSGTGRRISIGLTRIELKLKDAELVDNFETPPSRRNSFIGSMRHQT